MIIIPRIAKGSLTNLLNSPIPSAITLSQSRRGFCHIAQPMKEATNPAIDLTTLKYSSHLFQMEIQNTYIRYEHSVQTYSSLRKEEKGQKDSFTLAKGNQYS